MKTTRILTAALLGLAVASPRLHAQENDPRWVPWVGCWAAVGEEASSSNLLCVRPVGAAVEVTEIAGGRVASTQTLAADGRAYPISAEGCTGTRTAEFSADGRRIFTVTEQACDGDVARVTTGLIAMITPTEWMDIQAAQEDGEEVGWARRYRFASTEAATAAGFGELSGDRVGLRRARTAAAGPVDVDDVIEATRAVDPEGVRTWIAALEDPFDLDADRLLRLADAGVPSSVIDVMVAVSYPEYFSVDRDGDVQLTERTYGDDRGYGYGYGRRRGFFGYYDPFYYDPFYSGYGYGYGGYYGPGVVVVQPRVDPEPNARVVRGRGYTRGGGGSRTNSTPSSNARQPSGGSSTPSTQPSSEPSSQPSGDSGSSGSGSSEGRKAKPR